MRHRRGIVRFLLVAGLVFAIVATVAIWYGLEGRKFVDPLLSGWFAGREARRNELPTLHLDIGFGEYRALIRQRQRALQRGILQSDDEMWTQAQLRFQERRVPIRIRLKGGEADQSHPMDHWQEDKWSFHVQVRDEATILGMRSFSAQSPATCQYLDAWLYTQDIRRAGILVPRHTFANLSVNGEDWGVYALREDFSRESLESQGRREGVVLRLDESLLGERPTHYGDRDGDKFPMDRAATTFDLPAFARVVELDTTGVWGDSTLSEQAVTALGLLQAFQSRELAASQVFDAERMGQYIALADLWGARRGSTNHNERYYYDPLTSRLEPIGYGEPRLRSAQANLVHLAQYDDLAVVAAYAQQVTRFSQPEYLEELQAIHGDEFRRYHAALSEEFPLAYLEAPWNTLADRQAMLLAALHPPQTVRASWGNTSPSDGERHSTVDLQVRNLLHYPVVLRQLRVGNLSVDIQADWIVGDDGSRPDDDELFHREALPSVVLRRVQWSMPRYVTLRIPASVIRDLTPQEAPIDSSTLQIVTQLVGIEDQVVVDVLPDPLIPLSAPILPAQPSIEEAFERYPFLRAADQPGFLQLEPGTWHVEGDLVLPDGVGLRATDTVTLTFDQQAIFLSTGPLVLQGPDSGGVFLLPRGDYWAGLVVLDTDSKGTSSLYNVEIRATKGIRRSGWFATGGVTFYESPVVLYHSRLLDSYAQDALNIVGSHFELAHVEFGVTAGDAFDGDFAQGRIEECAFHDVLGNAIDIRGSDLSVQNVSLLRVRNEAISAGDSSVVTAQGIRATDVGIAIASKDMSSVYVQDARIAQAWTAGFAAYSEETRYGPASIKASRIVFEDDSVQAIVQKGNNAWIDGTAIAARELEVNELRRSREISPPLLPLGYRLGSDVWLAGYDLITPEAGPGDFVQFILYWRTFASLDRQYTVFAHVLDSSGEVVTGWDEMPRHNTFPTTDWPVGELIDDPHRVPLPRELPPGEYRIALGMYYWWTGERLPVYTRDGKTVPDAAIILEQTVKVK